MSGTGRCSGWEWSNGVPGRKTNPWRHSEGPPPASDPYLVFRPDQHSKATERVSKMADYVDTVTGARGFEQMVPMHDGVRLNTFVFLPAAGGPRWPVILHRTPYGIAAADAQDKFDCSKAWLPSAAEPMRGSILRGWRAIVSHGYAAVYQDTRGRHGSEGEDRVYADDRSDGHDTLEWIARQP